MIEPVSQFPVLVAENLEALRDFYTLHFGFEAVFFDADFYVHLLNPNNGIQLGFMLPGLSHQPDFLHPVAGKTGMVITFEVMDIQKALNEAKNSQLDFAMEFKEEPWGQSHFMVHDPAGFVVDIVQHTEP